MHEAREQFETTSWSRLLRIAENDPQAVERDLEELCRTYWYPLYAWLRRNGIRAADAEDTVQGFFQWLLTGDFVRRADPSRGRFRDLLRAALRQFQAREFRSLTAKKRSPGTVILSLDFVQGESRFEAHGRRADNPEVIFEKEWALAVIDAAMKRLEGEMRQSGKGRLFDVTSGLLCGQVELSGR